MSLSDIVNVQITRNTRSVSRVGFGTLLIVGTNPTFADATRIQFFSGSTALADLAAVLTGGESAPEYLMALSLMSQSPKPTRFALGKKATGDASYSAALSAIQGVSDDFYGVAITSQTVSDQESAAGWCNTRMKIFGCSTSAADVIDVAVLSDTTTIAAKLKINSIDRGFCVFSRTAATTYPECAVFGKFLPQNPGSYTVKFKTLSGIAADILTPTQSQNARDKNCMVYEPIGGVDITQDGKVGSGEFIDIMVFVDWLQASLQERIYSKLVNLAKIPFTDAGVQVIVGEIRAQLQAGIDVGGLASSPAPVVNFPAVADVSVNDRALRTVPDITFNAQLAGAIHSATIMGTVSV
jgi:hypothetical protein